MTPGICRLRRRHPGTDFYTPTSGLRIPTLGIAGSEDGSTPPDLVRKPSISIRGSQFRLLRGTGHVPIFTRPPRCRLPC